MRSYIASTVEDGEYATPNEINDELRELVGALHSVDRDNLEGSLTSAKAALGAWGRMLISESEQAIDVVHPFAPATFEGSEIHRIPFDLDAGTIVPWYIEFESGDCELEVELGAQWTDDVDDLESYVWIGIRVDGILVARSPVQQQFTRSEHGYVVWTVPVGAGVHVIEPVYGRPFYPSDRTIKWQDRSCVIRELAR